MAEVIRSTTLDDGIPGWVQQEWLDGRTWLLRPNDLPFGKDTQLIRGDLAVVAAQSGLVVDCRRVRGGLEVRARRDDQSPLQRARAWLRERCGDLISSRDLQRALYTLTAAQLVPVVQSLRNEGWLTPEPKPRRAKLFRVTAPERAA